MVMEKQLWKDQSGRVGEVEMVAADGRVTWLRDDSGSWWTPTDRMTPVDAPAHVVTRTEKCRWPAIEGFR
jgi:hypothetical protein